MALRAWRLPQGLKHCSASTATGEVICPVPAECFNLPRIDRHRGLLCSLLRKKVLAAGEVFLPCNMHRLLKNASGLDIFPRLAFGLCASCTLDACTAPMGHLSNGAGDTHNSVVWWSPLRQSSAPCVFSYSCCPEPRVDSPLQVTNSYKKVFLAAASTAKGVDSGWASPIPHPCVNYVWLVTASHAADGSVLRCGASAVLTCLAQGPAFPGTSECTVRVVTRGAILPR